jgi:hypothetical protein
LEIWDGLSAKQNVETIKLASNKVIFAAFSKLFLPPLKFFIVLRSQSVAAFVAAFFN